MKFMLSRFDFCSSSNFEKSASPNSITCLIPSNEDTTEGHTEESQFYAQGKG